MSTDKFSFVDLLLNNDPKPIRQREKAGLSPPIQKESTPIPVNNIPLQQTSKPPITIIGFKSGEIEYRNLNHELNELYINNRINDILSPFTSKYISVSTLTDCNMKTWLTKTKKITRNDIDISKIFNMLELYGESGNILHDKIYKDLKLQTSTGLGLDNIYYQSPTIIPHIVCEMTLTDENLKLKGRIDIINRDILIDIKTSRKEKDYTPQLSLYLYLCKLHNIIINEVRVWYVMLNKEVTLDIAQLESVYKNYLNKLIDLRYSLESNVPPKMYTTEDCHYCELENYCRSKNYI